MFSRKWLIVALVACALASACSQYNTNLSLQTSSSILSFVSPSTATVGGQGFTITANGSGFTTGALILWNGTSLTTTLVSANQLTAPVPASDIAAAGTVKVAVQIPGSAQSATQNVNNTTTTEVSNLVLFTIGAQPGPPPAITSLSASTTSTASTPYCSTQGFTLTVNGTNFTSDAVVNWNGVPLSTSPTTFMSATTFVSATQLTAAVPAANVALPGTPVVSVSNSLGTSNSLPLNLSTPTAGFPPPTITSVSPNTVGAGSQQLTITVQGNVLPCTVVQWVNSNNVTTTLPTIYVPAIAATGSPAEVVATVPAADIANPGSTNVDLINPGSPASSRLSFTIGSPSISSLSSSATSSNTVPACSPPGVTLTVTGTNFVNGSVVDWTTQSPAVTSALATTFVSSTQLVATIPAAYIASAGTVNIEVSNSGILSAATAFTISASSPPAPSNISISQTSATAGSAPFILTVNGTNLLPCSTVQWTNGSSTSQLATTYVSPTQNSPAQLSAIVPAADIATVGTAQVAVANPALSGNTSTPISFPITLVTITSLSASNSTPYCNPTGFTLTVTGTGFANGLVVNWNGSPRPTTLVSATQLTAAITPADTAFLGTGPAAVAITVSGSGPGSNSNSLKFSVAALPSGTTLPLPTFSSISPTNAAAEALTGPPVPLTVNGSGFSPCSAVQWNGAPLPASIFIGTSGMASVIPAANITAAATDRVSVTTPAPGGGNSNDEPFTVYTPGSPGSNKIAGGALSLPLMSADLRYAVFVLASTDGTTEVPGSTQNIFVTDTCTGVSSGCTPSTTPVSAGNGDSIAPAISGGVSADGRYVTFLSAATNLVATDTNAATDAFVRDTCTGAAPGCTPSTQLVSVTTAGTQANGPTTSATIDATGRYITFESEATNLGSISSSGGIFLRDTCAGAAPGCTPSTQPLN
jgi:trimeric autotransporter adhesin